MSTSVLHHRQVRYLYYRCRSHAGGRLPCRGVSVSAFQLEQLVRNQLSALEAGQFPIRGRRQMIADFMTLWKGLNKSDQSLCLREVIEKVVFDVEHQKVQIFLRPGAVGSLAGYVRNRNSTPR